MLKSFRRRAESASPGVVGHIQIGRIQNRQTRSGDRLMGGKVDHILITTASKDPKVAGAFVLDEELMQRLWGADLEKSQFGEFGKSRRLRLFAAGDTLEESCDTDRALFLKRVRACYSQDGETAEWYPGAEGQFTLPESMRHLVTGESGGRTQLQCLEDNCPLVLEPIRLGKTLYKDKARATFLFRIADAGAGIYDFDTTSEISGDAMIAMLGWVEKLTGGNMSAVPLEMVMAEYGTQHGSTVWRTSLQLACDLPEAMRLAHEWQRMKEVVGGRVVVEIKREEEDAAFTTMFQTEEAVEPVALHELKEECGWAFGIIGHDVGAVLVGFGANQHQPMAENINEDDRQVVIDALRQAVKTAQNPPEAGEPPPPQTQQQAPPPNRAEPSPPDHDPGENSEVRWGPVILDPEMHVPPPARTPGDDPVNWSNFGDDTTAAPPELRQRLMRLGIRLAQIRELIPDFSPQNQMTVGQCRLLIERFGA